MEDLQKRWINNHQRMDFVNTQKCGKRQNHNDEVTSRFANSENGSTHANKRKLTIAKDRTSKAMGQ